MRVQASSSRRRLQPPREGYDGIEHRRPRDRELGEVLSGHLHVDVERCRRRQGRSSGVVDPLFTALRDGVTVTGDA